MTEGILALLAALPLVTIFVLMVGLRWPAVKGIPVADNLGISHVIIVSLQNVGGSLGNMINIQKIITACAVIGLMGIEGLIIKRSTILMIFALLVSGIVGLILVFMVAPAVF